MYLHKHISTNNVSLESFPFNRELSMEAYLIENPTVLSMESEGFKDVEVLDYELPLLSGGVYENKDGRIDILAKYGEYLAVIELKIGELTETHLNQLLNYLKQKEQIELKHPWDTTVSLKPKWIGIMIGTTINPSLMEKIRETWINSDIPIAALTINRFKGKDGNVYVITDTYFIKKLHNRDLTKYLFNGQKFGKSKLVLAVISDFVEKNPSITFSQLKEKFPANLQGSEVFTTFEEANNKANDNNKRNFIKPNELITLGDASTIAVSTQWGINNINRFIDHCKGMNIDLLMTQ